MENQFLLTNGVIAREYLAKRIIVPASLRMKEYEDLSNVSGDRLVVLNDRFTNQTLRESVLFEGWNDNGIAPEMSIQVLIGLPKQKSQKLSPNKFFSVLEGKVISLGAEINVYVADSAVKNDYEEFLNRFDDCNMDGISIKVIDELHGGDYSEELEADLSWLTTLPKTVPISKSEYDRFERTASAILATVHHVSTEKQREATAALFVRRPLPVGILGSIVDHRRDVPEPKDRIFSRIADLALSSDRLGDAKAAAVNNSWVSKIRTLAKSNDTVLHSVLDGIEKFLENSLSWDKIDEIENYPALQAFVVFLRDSGRIPENPAVGVNPKVSDIEFAAIYLSALMARRTDLSLPYRRPVELESMAAALVATSLNNKSTNLDISVPEFKFVYEDDIFLVNDVPISQDLNSEIINPGSDSSFYSSLGKDQYVETWQVLTNKQVVIEIDGMKVVYSPSGFMKFSFLEEPKSKKINRLVASSKGTEPAATKARNAKDMKATADNKTKQSEPPDRKVKQVIRAERQEKFLEETGETPMLPLDSEQ
jgi:hypothetical protein